MEALVPSEVTGKRVVFSVGWYSFRGRLCLPKKGKWSQDRDHGANCRKQGQLQVRCRLVEIEFAFGRPLVRIFPGLP